MPIKDVEPCPVAQEIRKMSGKVMLNPHIEGRFLANSTPTISDITSSLSAFVLDSGIFHDLHLFAFPRRLISHLNVSLFHV